MKVFFTASRWRKGKHQKSYDMVRAAIKSFKVELISPEEDNYHLMFTEAERKKILDSAALRKDWAWHYEAVRRGIRWADAVIIEASTEDFQLGHEATLAIMEKKPVLCLSILEDFSKKIHHDYFFGARYTPKTIDPIVQDFFAKVRELHLARRFNMFLYPSQVEHLGKAAKIHGMNLSEYVRHIINLDRRAQSIEAASGNNLNTLNL